MYAIWDQLLISTPCPKSLKAAQTNRQMKRGKK